jgi:hypothetical protein
VERYCAFLLSKAIDGLNSHTATFHLDVNMERYAEEYDVAIVGGGPDILFLIVDYRTFSLFEYRSCSLTPVHLVFQLQSNSGSWPNSKIKRYEFV